MKLNVGGHDCYAYTGGRPFAPGAGAVVFVHGGGLDHTVWLLQSRYFAHHGHGVLAVDLPAHGRSAGEPLTSIEAMAAWIEALMEAARIERATLVGHSMGALVVLEAAARLAARAERLVMLGVSVPMPVSDALLASARAGHHAAFDMVNAWGHGRRAHLGGNQAPGMWMMGSGVRLLERSHPGVLYRDLEACNAYRDGLASAARITCPVHVLLGGDDRMSPVRSARALVDALPDPEVRILEGCGHMLMAERPGEVLDALIGAID